MPKLLSDKRHDGMLQPQKSPEDAQQIAPVIGQSGIGCETQLLDFQIPVAKIVPGELPQLSRDLVIAVLRQRAVHGFGGTMQPAEDPAVFQFHRVSRLRERRHNSRSLHVHQHAARRVPDLVGELTRRGQPFFRVDDIGARRSGHHKRQAHGIRTEFLVGIHRIDNVALGLRHLLPQRIADKPMNMDLAKRNITGQLQAHHHHARCPEEQNVEAGDHERRGVVSSQIHGIVRPSHGRKWPQAGAKPGVEYVRILLHARRSAMRAFLRRFPGHRNFTAFRAVPGWNTMAPPELARDAPVANVLHPVEERFFPVVGDEADSAIAHRSHRLGGHGLRPHKPLRRNQRLHNGSAAVAFSDGQRVRLDLFQSPEFLEVGHHTFASLETVQTGVGTGFGCHARIFTDHSHMRQIVPLASFEIVRIVRGSNLYHTSAELRNG